MHAVSPSLATDGKTSLAMNPVPRVSMALRNAPVKLAVRGKVRSISNFRVENLGTPAVSCTAASGMGALQMSLTDRTVYT